MEKINHYHAIIVSPYRSSLWDSTFEHKQFNVIGENTDYIVVDDKYFTTIKKNGKDYTKPTLDKEKIKINIKDSCFGDYVWYSLYTTKKKRLSTIKKNIQAAIRKDYGWLLNEVSLDIIK